MATIRDVARRSGVSVTTVSNVLHDRSSRVSPTTRQRVLDIIAELDYTPNAQARALSSNKTGLVALILGRPTDIMRPLQNPHDSQFVGAVEVTLSETGRTMLLCSLAHPEAVDSALHSWNVDGAIFMGVVGDNARRLRAQSDIPMVFVDNFDGLPNTSVVTIDDFRGGFLAGEALAKLGHTDIGFAGPPLVDTGVVRQRFDGFRAALETYDLTLPDNRIWAVDGTFEASIDASGPIAQDLPTALFVASDITGFGLIKGFQKRGVRVPDDVSLIGFDNADACQFVTPSLSTVSQQVGLKARSAVEILCRLLDDTDAEPEIRTLPVELILRESVRQA